MSGYILVENKLHVILLTRWNWISLQPMFYGLNKAYFVTYTMLVEHIKGEFLLVVYLIFSWSYNIAIYFNTNWHFHACASSIGRLSNFLFTLCLSNFLFALYALYFCILCDNRLHIAIQNYLEFPWRTHIYRFEFILHFVWYSKQECGMASS